MTRNGKVLLLLALSMAGAAGVGALVADARSGRTRSLLRWFAAHWAQYRARLTHALSRHWLPSDGREWERRLWAQRDPDGYLRAVVSDVHRLIRYVPDERNQGVQEYWQSPHETLSSASGDCEDSSILAAKYLWDAGLHDFHVVIGVANGQGHAWLESSTGQFADPTWGLVLSVRPVSHEPAVAFTQSAIWVRPDLQAA